MVALYIASTESAGKTALCAGISRKLIDRGLKVGFMEPIHIIEADHIDSCEDAIFFKNSLNLTESDELICPFRLSQHELWRNLTEEPANFTQNLKQAYRKISHDKDIVIMQGSSNLSVDKVTTLACYTIADALEARVIIAVHYSPNFDVHRIIQISNKIKNLVGVVINLTPESKIEREGQKLADSFVKAGIKVLGILPELRTLLGLSVNELARVLGSELLTSPEKADEIVENIMVGAMTVDSGITYFNRKKDKAVVIRGERADMQLAALETPTKCLIVANNIKPLPSVIFKAQEKHVPIITVNQDVSGVVAIIERALTKANFRSPGKLDIFGEVMDRHLDFDTVYSALGLKA